MRLPYVRAVIAIGLTAAANVTRGESALSLGPLFQDHAVFQRDNAIPVWGTADPGEEVALTFAGVQTTARADASGRWTALLPARGAGGPHRLEISTRAGVTRTLSDILVGDVFLCSGQSNMELGVARSRGGEAALARSADDTVRVIGIARAAKPRPVSAFDSVPVWQAAGPESLRGFSAVCYYFGREVHEALNVPVGLVNASWGGSAIEAWISEAGLRSVGGFDARLDLLGTFAQDEDMANQVYGRLWEDWWRSHGATAGDPWKPQDSGPWIDVPALRDWKTWGVPDLANHDGMVWYRRSFQLTPAQAAQAATLSLGGIDEVDETWLNGRAVGNTFGWGSPRTYRLPAGTLRAGENLVVVNVLSTWDAGGLLGPVDAVALTFEDGTRVPLGDGWRYRVAPLSMGRAPRAPWDPISGVTTLYNAMIAPIGPYGMRAVAWYQGETNADEPTKGYDRLLGGLMSSWRSQLGASLPFLIVQLPNFGPVPTRPTEANWSEIREAQRRAVANDRHAGLVVTIDIGERDDVHPSEKREVGRRLWRAARAVVYGEPITPSGPVPLSARREPPGLVVTFADVEGQLVTYSSQQAVGFELCGASPGSCRFVTADIDGTRVVLPAGVGAAETPTRVRFCWGPSPLCNLSDGSGLPVGPFEILIQ